jgi:hypothetical protein
MAAVVEHLLATWRRRSKRNRRSRRSRRRRSS